MHTQPFRKSGIIRSLPWLAGATWFLAGAASLIRENPTHALDAWMLIPISLSTVVLAIIGRLALPFLPRYGKVGLGIAMVAYPPLVIGQIAALFAWDAIVWVGFPVGIMLWIAGCALFGLALARHAIAPAWIGYAIALAQPAAIATGVALSPIRELSDYGSYTGALAHGVIWLAIAASKASITGAESGAEGTTGSGSRQLVTT